MRVAVLVSGGGTNLQALIDARDDLGGMDAAAAATRVPQARRSLVDLVA